MEGTDMEGTDAIDAAEAAVPGVRDWLEAGVVRLDDEREVTLSIDRFGTAKLTLTLDRTVRAADVDALERAADLFPYVRLSDVDGGDFPRRHAERFGRLVPLPRDMFIRVVLVEVNAPVGGVRVPKSLGLFGVEAHHPQAFDIAKAAARLGATIDLTAPADEQAKQLADAMLARAPDDAPENGAGVAAPAEPQPQPSRPAPPPPGARPFVRAIIDRIDAGFGTIGRSITETTRLPAELLCRAVLLLVLAVFVGTFTWQTWAAHARFGTYGFDLGIFDQGTWLLSQLKNPFVTVRGLNLFGDHASYILVLVAPLYWLWSDPRLLLLLQVIGLAAPAVAIYWVAGRRLANPAAGLALALAYLAYPAMQWAATWQFHPETLAAGLLAGAVAAAEARRGRLLAVCIALALLCKEDVGLVVAGFGVALWLTGEVRWGQRILLAGVFWFLVATFVLIPLVNGEGSPHFALNYGLRDDTLLTTVLSLPKLAGQAFTFALTNNGLRYLLLIFVPLALLPLASWRWLAPLAAPIGLHLAAVHPYQHEIRYHYLAIASLFLVLAATAGLAALTARRRSLLGILCVVLLLCVSVTDYLYGPAPWSKTSSLGTPPAASAQRYEALAMIDPDSGVSAQYHLISHLTHRKDAYEFPNPFIPNNYGLGGAAPDPSAASSVRYIILEPALLNTASEIDRQGSDLVNRLREDPEWETAYDNGGVLLLRRTGGGGSPSPPDTLQERP
jgi:uncharacterized membrane protein